MTLLNKIHAKVKQKDHLTFDEYMEMCLYYPGLGYYNNQDTSLDPKNSDFITGPEVSFLYAESLAQFYLKCKGHKRLDNIIEFGAGSGELCYNFLKNISNKDLPKKYYILEKSKYLIDQQKIKIAKLPKKYSDIVVWIDKIENIDNVFLIANEVLDALPAKLFLKKENKFHEKVIKIKNNELFFSTIDCDDFSKDKILNIEKRIGLEIPNNYSFEINFMYEKFFSDIFHTIENFVFIIIDYGYSEKEFYHIDRSSGTLQYYKKNTKIISPLTQQGSFDISISVDFSSVKRIAERHTIKLLTYTTQTQFLLNTGILENSYKVKDEFERNNILKNLLFPTDMGENFKIMIFCDDMHSNFELQSKDYRHKL